MEGGYLTAQKYIVLCSMALELHVFNVIYFRMRLQNYSAMPIEEVFVG